MKKVTVILASLALVVMLSGAALAAGPAGKEKTDFKHPQITKEQVEQINQARAKFLKDTLELRQKVAAKKIELKTLYVQPKPDKAKIKALALELVDLRAALAKKRIEAFSGLPVGPGFWRHGFGHRGFGPRFGHKGFGPGGSGHMGYGPGFGHMGFGPGGFGHMGFGAGFGYGPGACPDFGGGPVGSGGFGPCWQ
jgi:zinc resistance-associated protein